MPEDQRHVGKLYRGDGAVIRTPEEVAATQEERVAFDKPGAVTVAVYFATRGIDNPILKASMLASTNIRTATLEDFDKIFDGH